MKRNIQQRWKKFRAKRLPVMRTRWLSALPIIVVSLILLLGMWGVFGVRYATMANRFLLPNTAGREFKQSVKELFELDRSFLQQVRALCQEGTQDGSQMSDRLVRIHLLEDQIQAHLKGMSSAATPPGSWSPSCRRTPPSAHSGACRTVCTSTPWR